MAGSDVSNPTGPRKGEDAIIARALSILERRVRAPEARYVIDSPGAVHALVRLRLAQCDREHFLCVFADAMHRPIAVETLFMGTLAQVEVHPRDIARAALKHNAAAVVLVHNHPSGELRFSEMDIRLTSLVREALRQLGIKVLDHLLVAGDGVLSLATIEAGEEARKEQESRRFDHQRRARQSASMRAAWARRRAALVANTGGEGA